MGQYLSYSDIVERTWLVPPRSGPWTHATGDAPWHPAADSFRSAQPLATSGFNLFDLKMDPHEMKDVSGDPEYVGVLKTMKAELGKLRKQYQLPPLP